MVGPSERAEMELTYQGEVLRYYRVPFPAWNCELWAVVAPDGRGYYSIRALTRLMGLVSAQMQVHRLQEHSVLRKLIRQLPMPTERRGVRPTYVVQERGIGFWLGTMNLENARPEWRETLIPFQEAAVDALDSLVRGQRRLGSPEARAQALEDELARLRAYARMLEGRIGHIEGALFGELAEPDDDDDGDDEPGEGEE